MVVIPIMIDPKTMPRPRQVEILQLVQRLTKELGHAPTTAEVNQALGKVGAGVRDVLRQLELKGLVRYQETERRGAMKFPRLTRAIADTLTTRQREVYDAVRALERRLGRAPSISELNADQGMSTFGVHNTLAELEAKGAISFEARTMRGPIEITKEGKQWL